VLDNGNLVGGSADGSIKIWNLEDGRVQKYICVNSRINSLEFFYLNNKIINFNVFWFHFLFIFNSCFKVWLGFCF
jgi:WD40 repeat protein